MKITVIRNDNSRRPFNAFIADQPHIQGFGLTQKESIGDLVSKSPELFNAAITRLGRPLAFAGGLTPEQE